MIIDALPPQDAEALSEDLGVELDSPEHLCLENSPLCAQAAITMRGTKRKRVQD
jgi:26S proteasome regulatory subunit (ATPase 3-interacting protein)